MAASKTARTARPILFDDAHAEGGAFTGEEDYIKVPSRHKGNVVVDGWAGPNSIGLVLDNTPATRAHILELLAQAETSEKTRIKITGKNNGKHTRLVLHLV